jgi:hypothetical protein
LYPFSLRAISQNDQSPDVQLDCQLIVATVHVLGRISLLLESSQIYVSSGNETDVKMTLINYGSVKDFLSFSVEGIPAAWITTPSPINRLGPNDQR